ncbi:trans-aconitate 2-methyltransferase [Chelatococcus sp. SYSU_G07232]|uniref:Trans-aconitate 2-methyltransferase n=1 Tax=Chelatococcus albus TaxID=3047466 RepID=A0ABT7AH00_9HYPH|nr:trans-aconitate 2-methyltransferase [Chelatococcus sp. SYSU_G07232]MDJ1158645.1 trans-aconitate 2-methyltransferase [Chelatococcus sp. SYSU_G07232]
MTDWNARLYLRFEDERTRPARDLLAGVPLATARSVVDLGCGPGNSTELLAARFADAQVVGLDNAPDMLAAARRRLPSVAFVEADLAAWQAEAPVDLLFANAVLQWLPDHRALLPRLVGMLAPGGALAVQMPDNLDEPTHVAMRETAGAGPWAARFAARPVDRARLPGIEAYYDLLAPLCRRVDIWLTVYNHALEGVGAIVEWVKGTGLRPYLAPLDEGERAAFLAAYEGRLRQAYGPRADGRVLLRFPRLFIVAVR